MTKQEQIEEMTKLINSKEIYPCEDDVHCENCFCSDKDTAEKLYNAGYRKADDVRKETAREILDKLNALMEQYHYKSTAWRNCANFIKETYGGEVEE